MSEENESVQQWIQRMITETPRMTVTHKPLTGLIGWAMQLAGEYFGRPDRKFHSVIGIEVCTVTREKPIGWDQIMLQEGGIAVVMLPFNEDTGKYLVTAKQEPGMPAERNHISVAAALQASQANLEQSHGGTLPPRQALMQQASATYTIPQDAGRFMEKVNRYGVVDMDATAVERMELASNERWCSMDELRWLFQNGYANNHLAQALLAATL